MKSMLKIKTPAEWADKIDHIDYAINQAFSCINLIEFLPKVILSGRVAGGKELVLLLTDLMQVHARQYSDLIDFFDASSISYEAKFPPPPQTKKSFYFENMYSEFGLDTSNIGYKPLYEDELKTLLMIHLASYHRGQDRYALLKNHGKSDISLRVVWSRFFKDATLNAEKVGLFLEQFENLDYESVFSAEKILMDKIHLYRGLR